MIFPLREREAYLKIDAEYRDSDTGLIYLRARWMNPTLGRFQSMDTFEGEPENPLTLSKYEFTSNNPENDIDPSGNDLTDSEPIVFWPSQLLTTKCKVQVRFKQLGPYYYHAYILATDTQTGITYYYRGGPSNDVGSIFWPLLGASGGSGSRSSGSNSSGSNVGPSPGGSGNGGLNGPWGPWGPIYCQHGVYMPGSPDWDAGKPPSMNVVTNPTFSWEVYNSTFVDTLERINGSFIPYNPLSTNSNAVARTVLQDSALNPPPPPVWVPGWGTNLFN